MIKYLKLYCNIHMPHSQLSDIYPSLRPHRDIEAFLDENLSWFEDLAKTLGVPIRYLLVQALLHLPSFTNLGSKQESETIKNKLAGILVPICKEYRDSLKRLGQESNISILSGDAKLIGKYELLITDGAAKLPVKFDIVSDAVGTEVQEKLHYIRSARDDTIRTYGLFLDNAKVPYAYVSFSRANRRYQVDSLNAATGMNLSMDQVLTMTRAFAFDGSPLNSMSKLFHRAKVALKLEMPECKAIITALNPYLGFSGGIFTGASYFPYALSPMEYWYDENGLYVPRSKGSTPQTVPTPPIMWFARGMDIETSQALEGLRNRKPISITKQQYKKG